ncbi:MAG: transglycosylase domain-containing protein [Clostridia bacterium]|nr:transglycosylase domain-containing protein [Clostridia bacterium]
MLLGLIIGSIAFACIWHSETLDTTRLSTMTQTATFYDSEQQTIDAHNSIKYCTLDQINPNCINAFIAVEDKNFYHHHGLSLPRIAKALSNNLVAGYSKEGASTITQQLVKNTYLTNEKTLRRKLREAILALKLEQNFNKNQIIELYLNAIYFGNNAYGITNASEIYYHKTPAELTAAEGAGLAGIIKNPSRYDPITHHENFKQRAHLILHLMHEQNLITDEVLDEALQEPLTINTPDNLWLGTSYQNMAMKEASKILNLSENDIINYGYQIDTYYEPDKQQLLYTAMNQPENNLSGEKFALLSSSNGQVKAIWTSTPTLLTARRNFGSAMKPLLVYAPALDLGIVQPESLVDDSALIDTDFNPKNSDNQYHGLISVRDALIHSYNIPAVKVLEATTIESATKTANKMGLNLADENLSMALGNTKTGTTFLELAGGYQTIANQGKYAPARFIRSIRDRKGQTVYFDLTNKYNYAPQAIGPDTAYLLTDMLLDTTRKGTARKLASLNTDIAAKTGTTERENSDSNTDATLVSFTPENVLIVWHGNASMKPEDDLPHGANGGGRLANADKKIHSVISNPDIHFTQPSSVRQLNLDSLDYKNGNVRLANLATPDYETTPALFSVRYLPNSVSENYLITTPTVIDGQLTNQNTAQIWFDVLPYQTYEIYKNDILQAVIRNKTGIYTFTDKQPEGYNSYAVTASINGENPRSSNFIEIRLPNKNSTQVTNVSKAVENKNIPWYF